MLLAKLAPVVQAILKVSVNAATDRAQRTEAIVKILKEFGLAEIPRDDFDTIYVHTLVEYGVGKPAQLLQVFRSSIIRDSVQEAYSDQDRSTLDQDVDAVVEALREEGDWSQFDYNPKQDIILFLDTFDKLVALARTPTQVRSDKTLQEIRNDLADVQEQLRTISNNTSQSPMYPGRSIQDDAITTSTESDHDSILAVQVGSPESSLHLRQVVRRRNKDGSFSADITIVPIAIENRSSQSIHSVDGEVVVPLDLAWIYYITGPDSFRTIKGENHEVKGTNTVRFYFETLPREATVTYLLALWPRTSGNGHGSFRFESDEGKAAGNFSVVCEYEDHTAGDDRE